MQDPNPNWEDYMDPDEAEAWEEYMAATEQGGWYTPGQPEGDNYYPQVRWQGLFGGGGGCIGATQQGSWYAFGQGNGSYHLQVSARGQGRFSQAQWLR